MILAKRCQRRKYLLDVTVVGLGRMKVIIRFGREQSLFTHAYSVLDRLYGEHMYTLHSSHALRCASADPERCENCVTIH